MIWFFLWMTCFRLDTNMQLDVGQEICDVSVTVQKKLSVWFCTDVPFCSCVDWNTNIQLSGLLERAHHTKMMSWDVKAVPSAKCLIFKECFFCKVHECIFLCHIVYVEKNICFITLKRENIDIVCNVMTEKLKRF